MSLLWKGDLTAKLDVLDELNKKRIRKVFSFNSSRIESDMKSNARWTDRTGNARNGLMCTVEGRGDEITLVLSGSVPYQVYLETRWSGKYAIIKPSVLKWAPKVMQMCADAIFQ